MFRKFLILLSVVMALGSVSCRKQGLPEVIRAVRTMSELKTFRVSATTGSNSATLEYVCPDRVHQVVKAEGSEMESIDIANKHFTPNSDGSWAVAEGPQHPLPQSSFCQSAAVQATGGAFGAMAALTVERPKEPKYLGREEVDGQSCDSWSIIKETYAVHHPGQYVAPDEVAAVVCIEPSSHRILQSKHEAEVYRFYDFNQAITIEEPVASVEAQKAPEL